MVLNLDVFVFAETRSTVAIEIAATLSVNIFIVRNERLSQLTARNQNSVNSRLIQTTSFAHESIAMQSSSVKERATIVCL